MITGYLLNMKHKFTITYETDGLPICPDAIHEQLATAMVDIRKKFGDDYYKLPGLHRLTLEPCGDWFPEQQKPMRFEVSDFRVSTSCSSTSDFEESVKKE